MEIRQVRYFLAVAELKHFGRAAEQLHIVQPAVSQQIRRPEHELGVDLFRRTTRVVELTPAGVAFLDHAREIVAAIERAGQAVHHARLPGPVLRVGTGSGLGDLIAEALEELARRRPDLTVELVRLPEQQRHRQLAEGKLAAAIVRAVIDPLPGDVVRTTVLTERLVAALPTGRAKPRRSTVHLADLASMPARLPRPDQNAVLSDVLSAACQRIGTPLRRVAGGTDEDMLALIATGPPSWTVFYPRKAEVLARQRPRGVAFRRIVSPPVTVTMSVITRDDSPEARAFAESLRILASPRSDGRTLEAEHLSVAVNLRG